MHWEHNLSFVNESKPKKQALKTSNINISDGDTGLRRVQSCCYTRRNSKKLSLSVAQKLHERNQIEKDEK